MDRWEVQIGQVVIEKPTKNKSYIRTFVTKPNLDLLQKKGKIFGLIEIYGNNPGIIDLIDLIIDEVKENYYNWQNSANANFLGVDEQMEAALKKTNLTIAAYLESKKIALDYKKINIIVGLVHGQEIHFALTGSMGVNMFYGQGKNNYRIINVVEETNSPQTQADPLKFFSQIISGRLRINDIFFIATSNLLDYFSLDKIKNILTDQTPKSGIEQLKNLLASGNYKESFGAIILDLQKIPEFTKKFTNFNEFDYQGAAQKDSMKVLIKTERETEKFLTPSIYPEMKKYLLRAFDHLIPQKRASRIRERTSLTNSNTNAPSAPKEQNKLLKGVFIYPTMFFKKIGSYFSLIKSLISNLVDRLQLFRLSDGIGDFFKKYGGNWFIKYQSLPRSSKVLLFLIVILSLVFVQSLVWLKINGDKQQRLNAFNLLVSEINGKRDDAEASLIYRDENIARKMLIDAKSKLSELAPENKQQEQQKIELEGQLTRQLNDLSHMVEINEPIQLVNFANLDQAARLPTFVVLSGRYLYSQNLANKAIYKANLSSRSLSSIFSPTANTGNFSMACAISAKEIVFLNESKSVFKLNTDSEEITNQNISLADNTQINDLIAFSGRLYILDASKGQIYRFTKTDNGFGSQTNVFKENSTELVGSVSLTIDGDIWALNNGQILKFVNNKISEFKQHVVFPAMDQATKIRTSENSKYLYLLDPTNRRLVVFDKNGNLVNQYHSEQFNDLKDFAVSEADKTIYFLNGTAVYGVPAGHLK